jgi:hypothetical protein
MRNQRFHSFLLATAAAMTVGCAGQGGADQNTETVDLTEQVCSTKSSDCPIICVKEKFGECYEGPSDPCAKEGNGCEPPPDPCLSDLKHYEECPPPPPPPPPPPLEGCTLTQGFWKNHPDAWPVAGLTIGEETYMKAVLIAILQTPVEGNAALNLLHQYIAAALNVASGAELDPVTEEALADAHAWLVAHLSVSFVDGQPVVAYVATDSAEGQEAIMLKTILDQFNNGYIGPGHCDELEEPIGLPEAG